jgi:hypothetical protein
MIVLDSSHRRWRCTVGVEGDVLSFSRQRRPKRQERIRKMFPPKDFGVLAPQDAEQVASPRDDMVAEGEILMQ